MCPLCNSDKTYWLRGRVTEGARVCSDCKCTYDDEEEYTEKDVEELKRSYPNIYLIGKVLVFFNEN